MRHFSICDIKYKVILFTSLYLQIEIEYKIIRIDRRLLKEKAMVDDWSPKMGDYKKVNSQNDAKIIRQRIFKNRSIIISLITIELLILIGALLYFSL
ncbi:MAG: hypothetical protein KKB34_06635 [Bacteroidetes bacterium]|nr:hypothetical protein [Bacteroidota bacterium]